MRSRLRDANGQMLGFEFRRIPGGGDVRVRLIYPSGTVTHTMPERLAGELSRERSRISGFFEGKGSVAGFGNWSGPE